MLEKIGQIQQKMLILADFLWDVIGVLYALYQLIINYLSLSQVIDIEMKKPPPQEGS